MNGFRGVYIKQTSKKKKNKNNGNNIYYAYIYDLYILSLLYL